MRQKHTLAYLILGCEDYRPSSGEILFGGRKIAGLKIHQRAQLGITLAWQEPVKFEGTSVADYLSLGTSNRHQIPRRGRRNAIAELTSKVFGYATDEITIKEEVVLAGKSSRGLVKIRVALEGHATAVVTGMTAGNAEGARGHVDCLEIVKDQAVARAVPVVSVTHPLAKVTHEAAIGSIDRKQLETLIAHGVSPEQAVDMIVRGILR